MDLEVLCSLSDCMLSIKLILSQYEVLGMENAITSAVTIVIRKEDLQFRSLLFLTLRSYNGLRLFSWLADDERVDALLGHLDRTALFGPAGTWLDRKLLLFFFSLDSMIEEARASLGLLLSGPFRSEFRAESDRTGGHVRVTDRLLRLGEC